MLGQRFRRVSSECQHASVADACLSLTGVEVVPYTEIVDILDNLDRPACIAADGRLFYADCVLVADGANSKLRTTVFGVPSQESCAGYSIHRSIAKVTKEFREDPQCSREYC